MQPPACRHVLPFILLAAVLTTPVLAGQGADFSVVLLPDTQLYSEKFPDTYVAQTEWIRQRVASERIEFVIHLGDVVQTATVEQEWKNADRAHRVLDGMVPYSVLPGNHDGAPGETELFNKYFSPARFHCCPWYGGHMGETNDNNYCCFNAAGMKFLVLSLECHPRDETLAWASEVVQRYADRRVIVATHAYMNPKKRLDSGQRIFDQLVRTNENVFMVVCGHIGAAVQKTATNDAGGQVHEVLCDYQNRPNGGDGWLQLLRFVPDENQIRIEAYSPLFAEHTDAPTPVGTLEYDMSDRELAPASGRRFTRLGKLRLRRGCRAWRLLPSGRRMRCCGR